ncbi:hypothetical protein OROGR_023909 [Orobanche gracilis]
MATESPIRISEGTNRRRTLKQSTRYRPSSSEMAIKGLDLFLKDQKCQILEKDVVPSRSGSAPPSMEGSLAAVLNIFPNQKLAFNHKHEVHFNSGGSLGLPRKSLPAHEEGSLSVCPSRSVTLTQDARQPSSPSYNLHSASTYKSVEKKVVSQVNAPPVHEGDCDVSLSNTGDIDVESSHIYIVNSANVSSRSNNSESQKLHKNEQATPQASNTSRAQDTYAQISYPGISYPYGSLNQFHYLTSPGPFYYNPPPGFLNLQYSTDGYSLNSVLPSYIPGYSHQGALPLAFDSASFHNPGFSNVYAPQNSFKFLQPPFHMQYFQPPLRYSYGTCSHLNYQTPRDGVAGVSQMSTYDSGKGGEFVGLSKDYNLNAKIGNTSNYYFGSPTDVGPLRVSPAVQSTVVTDSSYRGGRYNSSVSHSNAVKTYGQSHMWKDVNLISFLEELKSGKGQRLELRDIAGYIVEFSVDQHGSRFIQQKLETCSSEEKASVFKEVVPHASKLITDVFGNYVVQKLFEHGNPEQRMNLADQLEGHILSLSLQMYGCRVIQKALDFIGLEQKIRLVRELDGHILRCVRDQNGNHVVQKCIESIPIDNIHFVISSFHGQVATLSMHPYGCRVIQRFLEHCNDNVQTKFIVDEILDSVCLLAQDQYGNYVTQHALERGKPRERSRIIEKLGGSVVKLSQHKFASNVVEKCLEYSDSTAREILIKEIVGDGGKNDNLLVMMKDQYANYVIQRILEKCSSDHREVLLGQIRNHLTSLKKYTYGKHIVARFEELFGEGRATRLYGCCCFLKAFESFKCDFFDIQKVTDCFDIRKVS